MVYGPGRYKFFDIENSWINTYIYSTSINNFKFQIIKGNLQGIFIVKRRYRKLSVPQFTIVTGLFIIFFGTLILSSLYVHLQRLVCGSIFYITSAITVTGLTIIDIGVDLNFFGQFFWL